MDKQLLMIRRGEVDREMERLQARLDALAVERRELDIAEKVFDRLSGGRRNSTSEKEERPTTPSSVQQKHPTIRQMIMEALMDARQRALPGRNPQQIRDYVKATYGLEIAQPINTTASRMWRDLKEIDKDVGTGLFRLFPKEKPADLLSPVGEESAGLSNPEAQGREAGPGGGT